MEKNSEQKTEEKAGTSLFHYLKARRKDVEEDMKIVLQRLIVIARLPHDDLAADRTELGAHYEKLNLKLSKQYSWDHMTGLLLIYPSCLLHVIESSREVLVAVLKDLTEMQQQSDGIVLEAAKVVFMANDPESRLFQQWSCKVLNADQLDGDLKGAEDEEGNTESLVCCVLSALQNLSEQLETSKAPPGSVLDETPDLIVSQEILNQLLAQEDLQSPEQYLQAYNSPLNISMDFGKRHI
ncbi:testis-expressed protein 47-like [Scomber scombrus]|uniref:testis-expressed protein 47-like n=1 Tax=Scomber scombrus TaxID=13677 RepID=UPI002DD880D3|nr:testis-expressed protein 47-like [Scomber scombrus]